MTALGGKADIGLACHLRLLLARGGLRPEIRFNMAERAFKRRAARKLAKKSRPRANERELKLLVDADHLADFIEAPTIATNLRNKGTRKHLKVAYYDTRKQTLRRNRLSLRDDPLPGRMDMSVVVSQW